METEGQAALTQIVSPPRWTRADLARELKVTSQAVGAWTSGIAKPSKKYRAKLQRLLGIPADSWDRVPAPAAQPGGAAA